jgi:hypothetical protein
MKTKNRRPENVEFSDLDNLQSKRKFTREYIEKRIQEQNELSKQEQRLLTPELKLYYETLTKKINEIKNKKI